MFEPKLYRFVAHSDKRTWAVDVSQTENARVCQDDFSQRDIIIDHGEQPVSSLGLGRSAGCWGNRMAMKKEAKSVETILVEDPSSLPGKLQRIGGSKSDTWNNVIANQAAQTVWTKNSDEDERKNLLRATIAGLIGIGPKDEVEGMIAAQLLACHNASMECYRRAMIGEQTFEGRRENLGQQTSSPGPTPPFWKSSIGTVAKGSKR